MSNQVLGYLWQGDPQLPRKDVWNWVQLEVAVEGPPACRTPSTPASRPERTEDDQSIPVGTSVAEKAPSSAQFGVALGTHVDNCLDWLRDQNLQRLAHADNQPPVLKTLILALPVLAQNALDTPDIRRGLTRNIIALDAVARVIVFVCPTDTELDSLHDGKLLGRDGSSGPMHPKVEVIDISNLLDEPRKGIASLCRSCEALGLIERLARGMSVDTALGKSKAVRMSAPST